MKLNKIEQHALVTECRTSGMKANAWCEAKGIEYRQYLGTSIIETKYPRR